MCGRFTLFEPSAVLSKEFGVPVSIDFAPRYNIAPSQMAPVVRASPADEGREFTRLRWGLIPSWAKDPSIGNRLINARAETAVEKPAFRSALRHRRCLVPASGFYEWQKLDRKKQPFYIRMRDGLPFAFAGLWEHWEDPGGSTIETYTILTTAANTILSPIHDRMPVIVAPGEYNRWLDPSLQGPDSLAPLLVPFPPEEMLAFPVGPRVNTPSFDDARCIDPLP
ncbi:MAG: SOS response-associated peptidase [Candidatus Deferrimicrobiota bacterium]